MESPKAQLDRLFTSRKPDNYLQNFGMAIPTNPIGLNQQMATYTSAASIK